MPLRDSVDSYHLQHCLSAGYMQHAFPQDDLRPLSCRGHDTQGGFGNTLVDTLDTLLAGLCADI